MVLRVSALVLGVLLSLFAFRAQAVIESDAAPMKAVAMTAGVPIPTE